MLGTNLIMQLLLIHPPPNTSTFTENFKKTKEKESRKKRKWTIKMNNETSKEESQKKLKLCMQNKIAVVIAS